jgi:hypothetical protein
MKYEIIFDYFDDVISEKGIIVDRIVRNSFTISEAESMSEAKIDFYKYCTGIIRSIKEVKR